MIWSGLWCFYQLCYGHIASLLIKQCIHFFSPPHCSENGPKYRLVSFSQAVVALDFFIISHFDGQDRNISVIIHCYPSDLYTTRHSLALTGGGNIRQNDMMISALRVLHACSDMSYPRIRDGWMLLF